MHSKLFVAGLSVVVSLVLLSWSSSTTSLAFTGAVVAMLSAMAWGLSYFAMARQLILAIERDAGTRRKSDQTDERSDDVPGEPGESTPPTASGLEATPDGAENGELEVNDAAAAC